MELNHLKYFYIVAKEGGYSNAAKVLHVAQPAISKMVKNLEESLEVQLFERVGRHVRLTKIGNDVFRKCEVIFTQVNELQQAIQPQKVTVSGPLNVCAADVISSHLLPSVLSELLTKYPLVYPQVTTTTAHDALHLLSLKKVDAALLFHAPEIPQGLEVLQTIPIGFKVVVLTKHKNSKHVCSSFLGSREVDDTGNKVYPTLNKLRKKYPDAQIKASANSLNAHYQMVLAGLGVSVLPEFLVAPAIKTKKLTALLDKEEFTFQLKVVTRTTEPPSDALRVFLELFKASQQRRPS